MNRQQILAAAMERSTLLQVILTVRDEEKWHRSVEHVIVRLYRYLLQPFFWHTHLGRQYTAIIGWNLEYMFNGEANGRRYRQSRVAGCSPTLAHCRVPKLLQLSQEVRC